MGNISSASAAQPWKDITLSDFRQITGMSKGTTVVKNNGSLSISGKTITLVDTDQTKRSSLESKNALIKALANAHATSDFINVVRRNLGLEQVGDTFQERANAKPLDKRTVKLILDAYSTGEYATGTRGEIRVLGGKVDEKTGGLLKTKSPGKSALGGAARNPYSAADLKTTEVDGWQVVGDQRTDGDAVPPQVQKQEVGKQEDVAQEPPMMHRSTMRVPEPKWDEFDVDQVKDGRLTPEQLSYLEMNPSKTNGPVTVKFPKDIPSFSETIHEKSVKLKGKDLSKEQFDCHGMLKFLRRGDYDFQVVGNPPVRQRDIHSENDKEAAAKELISQLETLFGDDKLLMHALNDLFEGHLSIPCGHQFEDDAFCFNFDFPTGKSKSKSTTLSKNLDGSYRVSIEIEAKNVKGATLFSDVENSRKYFKVDGENSFSYSLTFDLTKDGEGLAVIKPVAGWEPTLNFDLRGCTVTESGFGKK